jgi:hypothetical protein
MAIGLSRRGRWSKPNRGPDRHRRQTALEEEALRPKMAVNRLSSITESPHLRAAGLPAES